MPELDFDLTHLTDDDGCLVYPIVYWRGRLSVFFRPGEGTFPHQFGGSLPPGTVLPNGAVAHALLNIDTEKCAALEGLDVPFLPLIYPFRHDGGLIIYKWTDTTIAVTKLTPEKPTEEWPYEGFPDILPPTTMASSAAYDMDSEEFEELLWQGAWDVSDDKVIIVIPPREDYGVSLWGEIGDTEMVQCVFIYDPATGRVTAENQCG